MLALAPLHKLNHQQAFSSLSLATMTYLTNVGKKVVAFPLQMMD